MPTVWSAYAVCYATSVGPASKLLFLFRTGSQEVDEQVTRSTHTIARSASRGATAAGRGRRKIAADQDGEAPSSRPSLMPLATKPEKYSYSSFPPPVSHIEQKSTQRVSQGLRAAAGS
jgi:hypothetical protein